MPVRPNPVKETLRNGGTVYSSSVRLPEPGLCEVLGYAGFDFVLIDGEHGGMDFAAVDRMVQSCFAGGTVPMYRVLHKDDAALDACAASGYPLGASRDAATIMKVLDLGVQGILIPHCCTAADAAALKRAALYPPKGARGFGPGRGMQWGRISTDEYFAGINETVFLFALIEDPEGIENIDEIAAAGLDCLWVGTGDLALSYGVAGQRKHPKVMEAAEKVLGACDRHNVAAGYPAADIEDAKWAAEQGYRAIGFGGAEGMIMQAARGFLEAVGR